MLERQPRAGSSYQETQVVPPGGQRRFVFETTPPPPRFSPAGYRGKATSPPARAFAV